MTIAYTYMHTHWTGLGIYFFLFHSFLNFFAHLTIWLIYELVSCYLLGYFFSKSTILALTCPATCAVLSVALSLVWWVPVKIGKALLVNTPCHIIKVQQPLLQQSKTILIINSNFLKKDIILIATLSIEIQAIMCSCCRERSAEMIFFWHDHALVNVVENQKIFFSKINGNERNSKMKSGQSAAVVHIFFSLRSHVVNVVAVVVMALWYPRSNPKWLFHHEAKIPAPFISHD